MEEVESRWSQTREEGTFSPYTARNGFKLSGHPQMAESSIIQVEHARTIAQLQLLGRITTIFDIFTLKYSLPHIESSPRPTTPSL